MGLSFSISGIFKFMLIAVIIFVLFRVITNYLPILISKERTVRKLKKYLPFFELFIWIIFSVWVFKNFLVDNQYFAIALFILVLSVSVWVFITFLKDYIAGIIFKTGNELNIDDHVQVLNYSGKIKKLNFRTVEIELEDNKLINLPYSKIFKEEIVKSDQLETNSGYTFNINIPSNDESQAVKDNLYETVICSPWASLKKDPIVKLIDSSSNHYLFEVTVFAVNDLMCEKIEDLLKDKYSEK